MPIRPPTLYESRPGSPSLRLPLRDQIHSELIKARSARFLWALPLLAVVLGPASALFVGLTGSLQPEDTILGGALTGTTMTFAVVAAWGALVVTTEYSSGTMNLVLAATPHRSSVLAAKSVVLVVVASVVGLLTTALAFVVGLAVLDPAKYERGEPFPALLGIVASFPAVALLGLAVGVVLRTSAGAIAVVLAQVVLPELSSHQITGPLRPWIRSLGPTAPADKLAQKADAAAEIMGSLGGWPRLAILMACTVAAVVIAGRTLERRDI